MFQYKKDGRQQEFVILPPVKFQQHQHRVLPVLLITGGKAPLHFLISVHFLLFPLFLLCQQTAVRLPQCPQAPGQETSHHNGSFIF